MEGQAGAFMVALEVVYTADLVEAYMAVQEVECTQAQVAACMQVQEVVCTLGQVEVCMRVPEAVSMADLLQMTRMLIMAHGDLVLPALPPTIG